MKSLRELLSRLRGGPQPLPPTVPPKVPDDRSSPAFSDPAKNKQKDEQLESDEPPEGRRRSV